MKNIECFFVSDFLICKIHSNRDPSMESVMNSIKDVKAFIETLYEDLKNEFYSLSS